MSGPVALLLGLLAVPIVYAFLRRVPPTVAVVASLVVFGRMAARRSRRFRIAEWVALLLLLGALGALVWGLVGGAARTTVVVLDNSASMATTIDGRSRWHRALDFLDDHAWRRPLDRWTTITLAPLTLHGMATADQPALRASARGWSPAGVDSPAVDALVASLCAGEHDSIVWASDRAPPTAPGCEVVAVALGPRAARPGLVALAVSASEVPGTFEVQLEGDAPSGWWLDEQSLQGVSGQRFATALPQGELVARLPEGPELGAQVPLPAHVRVALVTDWPHGHTATALRAHPSVSLELRDPSQPQGPEVDLLVVESEPVGAWPAARHSVAFAGLPRGQRASWIQAPTAVSVRGALMHHVQPEGLAPQGSWGLAVAPGAEVLAASNQGALAVREGKHVRLGFEPSRSDWPQRVDYAHFIANVLAWSMPGSQGVVQRGVHRTELADAGGHPGEQPRPWLPTAALLAALLLLFEAVWSSSIHGRHP